MHHQLIKEIVRFMIEVGSAARQTSNLLWIYHIVIGGMNGQGTMESQQS